MLALADPLPLYENTKQTNPLVPPPPCHAVIGLLRARFHESAARRDLAGRRHFVLDHPRLHRRRDRDLSGASITVKSRRGPFTYVFGSDVHVFGPDSKPMGVEQVHKGEKVTVSYYHRGGEEKVARIAVLSDKDAKTR